MGGCQLISVLFFNVQIGKAADPFQTKASPPFLFHPIGYQGERLIFAGSARALGTSLQYGFLRETNVNAGHFTMGNTGGKVMAQFPKAKSRGSLGFSLCDGFQ